MMLQGSRLIKVCFLFFVLNGGLTDMYNLYHASFRHTVSLLRMQRLTVAVHRDEPQMPPSGMLKSFIYILIYLFVFVYLFLSDC